MDERDMRANVSEIERLFDCRVAAADDSDRLVAIEKAVAGRAGAHAFAHKGFFRR